MSVMFTLAIAVATESRSKKYSLDLEHFKCEIVGF
jgi:hypothetical protein